MKRMTDDVKWIVYGGQKQIKRLPWLDLEKIRINAVTEDVELEELDIQVQVEAEAVEVTVESNSTWNKKGRRKRKGRKKRLPSVESREVQTEAPMETEEAAREAEEVLPPATPDLSALLLPELPKTPNCAWVHPGCKVELRGVPIHEVMRTKTTLQCWCGEKPKMIEITTQTCLLSEEQSTRLGQAQGQGRRARKLPDLTDVRRQGGGGGGGGGCGRRVRPKEGEWVAGKVRLPPITPTNTPLSSADEMSCALSGTSLLSLCRQATPLGSACSSVTCAGRARRRTDARSTGGDTPLSAASSIPLTPLLPLDALPDRRALPGISWHLAAPPLPLPADLSS